MISAKTVRAEDFREICITSHFSKSLWKETQPGLGNVILTSEHPSQKVLDTFRTPISGHHDYTIVVIDTKAFENGGTLTIDIELGRGR